MKVEVVGKCKINLPFPKLMAADYGTDKEVIILAAYSNNGSIEGTVVSSKDTDYKTGDHGEGWSLGEFVDFVGTVTIKS